MVCEPGEPGLRRTGVVMEEKKKKRRGITIRLGPLGLSLLAAGITAVGLAAVSLADSGSGSASNGGGAQTFSAPGPGGGVGVTTFRGPNLSAADRQKMEDFRKCMEDNGAPGPPRHIDPSDGPPKPPSAADRQKIQKAYEACRDKLPEDLQKAGPPGIATFKCGPPPGRPGQEQGHRAEPEQRLGHQLERLQLVTRTRPHTTRRISGGGVCGRRICGLICPPRRAGPQRARSLRRAGRPTPAPRRSRSRR